jgi:glycosyltransferase involved in cell wall biosynthesis
MTTEDDKVVIFLATLNGAKFLKEQLQSYRDQTHSNWELLVSDDGSVDQTVELVGNFANSVPQRVTLVQGARSGFCQNFLSMARRSGSDGAFFAFSDQDDVWLDEKLEKAITWLKTIPRDMPAIYFTRTILIGENGEFLGFSPLFKRAPSFQNALVQNIGGGNTMVFNREAQLLLAATSHVAPVSHDWWTYQLVTGVGGIAHYDPLPTVKYRQHAQNLVGSNAGLQQRYVRSLAFVEGRFMRWNEINIEALDQTRHLLTPSNLATLDRFARARKTPLLSRLFLLWRAGVYRQSPLESISIFAGSVLGRI